MRVGKDVSARTTLAFVGSDEARRARVFSLPQMMTYLVRVRVRVKVRVRVGVRVSVPVAD